MSLLISGLLFLDLATILFCYYQLYRKRHLFNDRFGMNITMTISMVSSLVIAIHLSLLFPAVGSFLTVVIITALGLTIGIFYGSLVKYQSILAGIFGGTMGGLMGSMLGVVIKNPSLCNLPQVSTANLISDFLTFGVFGSCLLLSSLLLFMYSLKV